MTTLDGSAMRGILPARWVPRLVLVTVRRLLDAVLVGLVLAMLAGWADPDLVLDAMWVTLAIGAFVVGLRGTVVRIALITLIALAAWAGAWVLSGQPSDSEVLDPEWPLMVALSILIAVLADRVSTTARRYITLYRQASDRLVTAHEDERARLARDLHDGVGQTLTAVALTLDRATAALAAERGAESGVAAVRRARTLALAALDEAHSVAAQLRPARIDALGLGAAVSDLAESAGVPVDIWFSPSILPPGLIEPGREIDAYRIIQEALGNAARHSHATHVWIDAEVRDGAIRVRVGDNGVGFDRRSTPMGMGVAGMEERAAILQGRLEVRSQSGTGTTVDLLIPVLIPPAPGGLQGASVRSTDGAVGMM
jgi:two-component system sensor histidine kinase UhpB